MHRAWELVLRHGQWRGLGRSWDLLGRAQCELTVSWEIREESIGGIPVGRSYVQERRIIRECIGAEKCNQAIGKKKIPEVLEGNSDKGIDLP